MSSNRRLFFVKNIFSYINFWTTLFSKIKVNFRRTQIHCIHKIQWFLLSMLIIGQKYCCLGPTIFEIPQPNWHSSASASGHQSDGHKMVSLSEKLLTWTPFTQQNFPPLPTICLKLWPYIFPFIHTLQHNRQNLKNFLDIDNSMKQLTGCWLKCTSDKLWFMNWCKCDCCCFHWIGRWLKNK